MKDTLEEFTLFIKEAFMSELPIQPNDDLTALGVYDSISKLMLIAAVDRRFEVVLTPQQLKRCKTPRELYRLVVGE